MERESDNQIYRRHKERERVVAALVIASWYIEKKSFESSFPISSLITLFHEDLSRASEHSTTMLLELKQAYAVAAPEFGIDDRVFLRLDIPGDTAQVCQSQWYPRFNKIYTLLGIDDLRDRHGYLFSGLGYESLQLCVVAYRRDWNKAFVYHEYLHIKYKGFCNPFFDEMLTESLAYAQCGYIDLEHNTIFPKRSLVAAGINVDYYDALEYFLSLCQTHPTLFPSLRTEYETGDGSDSGLDHVAEIIGRPLYERLYYADPSAF